MSLFLLFSLGSSERNYAVLTQASFNNTISQKRCVLVRYFSHHQDSCVRSHKDFNFVAKAFYQSSKLLVSALDCGKYRHECLRQRVFNLPTIRMFCGSDTHEYDGGYSYESIINWASEISGQEAVMPKSLVASPNGKTFKQLLDDNACVLGFFHTPWCSSCKRFMPRLNRVARIFQNETSIAFAEVDVDRYRSFLREYDLHVFPEIKLFVKGEKKPIDYGAKRSPKIIVDFINHYCGTRMELNDVEGELGLVDEANTLTEEFFAEKRNPLYIQKMKNEQGMQNYIDLLEGLLENGDKWLDMKRTELKSMMGNEDLKPKEKDELTKKINIISFIKELIKHQ